MVKGNGGSENGPGGACRIQTQAADILHSSGLSGNKAAEPEGRSGFAGEGPEANADAENTVGSTAAVMPETQDSAIVETETPKQRDSKRNDTEYSETEYSKTEKNETDLSAVCQPYQSYQSYQSCTSSQ